MVRLVFWIDTKAGIGQSTFRQNDGHHEKEEKESKNSVIDNEPKNSNYGYQLEFFQDEKEAKKQNKEKQKDGEGTPKVVTEVDPNKYNFKRKELSPDDQIRVLHEAYQFLLKKHKLGEDPRCPKSESDQQNKKNALVSPFMKMSIEKEEEEEPEPEPEEVKSDSDTESGFDDDVFALEKAVDSALDSTSPQPSASEQEMAAKFKRKPNSIKGAPTKKPSLKRQKVTQKKLFWTKINLVYFRLQ